MKGVYIGADQLHQLMESAKRMRMEAEALLAEVRADNQDHHDAPYIGRERLKPVAPGEVINITGYLKQRHESH